MTLDEVIEREEQEARKQREFSENPNNTKLCTEYCIERAEEHEQLAEWLKELKNWRSGKRVKLANEDTETLIFVE